MHERIFIDKNGKQLIVRHRKSAVFFLREIDLSIEGYVSPYWRDRTPVVHPKEMNQEYVFSQVAFEELVDYMERIAQESWKNFAPKNADSFGADYAEYYDKDFDNNGYLSLIKNCIQIKGPSQRKTSDPIVRLYKFNKRKFESFVYDLRKVAGA